MYCLFISLFAKKSIRFRYIKLYCNLYVCNDHKNSILRDYLK